MAVSAPRLVLYDRWGTQISDVGGVIALTRTEEVNGEDSLTVTTTGQLSKGQRIVMRDRTGTWHEYVVSSLAETHDSSGSPAVEAWCESSVSELRGDYITDLRPGVSVPCSARQAMEAALSPSRWEVGTVDVPGTAGASLYHVSSYKALSTVVSTWGGEVRADISVDGDGVVSRAVSLLSRRGSAAGRRFEWGRDLASVRRIVDASDVITACYAWGKGEQVSDDGYGRRIGIADVNDGVAYVADEEALELWGRPAAGGGKAHVFGEYVNEDCDDPTTLKSEAEAYLAGRCEPLVSYEADVLSLGQEWLGVELGDTVDVIDTGFTPALRLSARVMAITWDELQPSQTKVTISNLVPDQADAIAQVQGGLDMLRGHSASWDAASDGAPSYIDRVITGLNSQINATGGWTYIEPGEGITVYDRPRDQEPTMAIQLGGGSFRIANTKTGSGEWDWRTFGTGAGFVADLITAGTLNASLIKAGILQDATGTNYWNMETGDFRLTGVKYWLASCPTAADVTAKVATVAQQGFALTQGVMVLVEWANGNSAEAPTLDVGGTGAYPVKIYGSDLAGGTVYDWAGGSTGLLYFDGGAWNICDNASLFRNNQAVREVRDLDSSLDSQGVFDRLTHDGELQGLFMQDGNLYANATYVRTGILSDGIGKNFWNMDTGEFSLSAGTKVGGQTVDQIAGEKADAARIPFVACSTAAATAAKTVTVEGFQLVAGAAIMVRFTNGHSASTMTMDVSGTGAKSVYASGNNPPGLNRQSTVLMTYSGSTWTIADSGALYNTSSLDKSLDQQEVFDRLTDGGQDQGIYLQDGRIYINGEYIKANTVVAYKLGSSAEDYAQVGDFTVRYNGMNVVRSGIIYYKDGHPRFMLTLEGDYGNPAIVIMAFTSDTDVEIVYMSYNGAVSMSSIDGQYSMFVNSRGLVIQQGTTQKVVATF